MGRISWSVASLLAVSLLCGATLAQDDLEDRPADDAASILKEGLSTTAKMGGFAVKGSVELETSDRRYAYYARSLGSDGDFSAKVGSNGVSYLSLETKEGQIEIWRKGRKTVHRAIWTNSVPNPGVVGNELSKLLALKDIRRLLDKAEKLKVLKEREINGTTCRVVQGRFPVDMLKGGDLQQPTPGVRMVRNYTKVARVVLKFNIGAEDNVIRRIDVTVLRTIANMRGSAFRRQNDDDEEEEEGEEKKRDEVKNVINTTKYTLQFSGFNPELKVEIPKAVRKRLED